jgi:aryl carrier-like protein
LAEQLPEYMVPSAYIPVDEMPITATGKTDRRRLRDIGEALTLQELAALQPSRGERRPLATEIERRLQGMWASVLTVDAGSIGADDNFLQIGGDSIGAMRLVGAAREQGMSFTVADVFRTRRLSDLARVVSEITPLYEDPPPFFAH